MLQIFITEKARPAGSLWLLGQPSDRVSGQAKRSLDCPKEMPAYSWLWSEVKPRVIYEDCHYVTVRIGACTPVYTGDP